MPPPGQTSRAGTLGPRLERALSLARSATDDQQPVALGYFPRPKSNPFPAILYSQLWTRGIAPFHLHEADEIAELVASTRRPSQVAFHLQWTYPILREAPSAQEAQARVDKFLASLDGLREAGIPLVWTVHNVLPHDCHYVDVEVRLRAGIAARADLVHTMCDATSELTSPYYQLPSDRTVTIPHPTYDGWYPTLISREQARFDLRLSPKAPTYVLVGNLRIYKGLDLLFDAFERVRSQWPSRPRPRLLVAGRPFAEQDHEHLEARVQELDGAAIEMRRISEERMATYLQAADVVVLPYERILNSGVLLAAMTFSRTVVVPRTGCLPSIVSEETSSSFDPRNIGSLAAAMARAMSLASRPGQPERVRTLADRHRPEIIGATFADAIDGLVDRRP